jgi:hypothetical protein
MTDIQLLHYAGYEAAAHDGLTVWGGSSSLKLTLHTNSYTPNRTTHTRVSDLTNELSTGSGYTAGGVALSSPTTTVVAANSWASQWAASTAYKAGQLVRPTVANTYVYRATNAGSSGGSQPTWPTTIGQTVTDSGVTWVCAGKAVVMLDAAQQTTAERRVAPEG